MVFKPAIRRAISQQDIETAANYYFTEGGEMLAVRFLDALEFTIKKIQEHSGIGSIRYSELLGFTGLRNCMVPDFPYIVFYLEQQREVSILRVLHSNRDIPTYLNEAD